MHRCDALVDQTGAGLHVPFIIDQRARLLGVLGDPSAAAQALREAQRVFVEMGADGHATRLDDELPAAP